MKTLHSINALRVIAEYIVVRFHVFEREVGMDMFVRDLMSFFFVLSGFVMMHSHHKSSFVTFEQKKEFWVGRWKKIYPVYILNQSFYIPSLIIIALDKSEDCAYRLYCPLMQVFFLNSWAGCGVNYIMNASSWYIATLSWLWFSFPVIHRILKMGLDQNVWFKMICINIMSVLIITPFSEYEMFSLCTLPVLRMGEFIIGCGVSVALEQQEFESMNLFKWIPFVFALVYFISVYTVLALPHGMKWLCLHEVVQSYTCRIWQKSEWIEDSPPCHVIWDKYFNKHAILWATIIYTIASAEKCSQHGVLIRALNHDIFKTLSAFSISVYLGHMSIKIALDFITDFIGFHRLWSNDTLLLTIYLLCYVLHLLNQRITDYIYPTRAWQSANDQYTQLCHDVALAAPDNQ
jgi:hypothetical protein